MGTFCFSRQFSCSVSPVLGKRGGTTRAAASIFVRRPSARWRQKPRSPLHRGRRFHACFRGSLRGSRGRRRKILRSVASRALLEGGGPSMEILTCVGRVLGVGGSTSLQIWNGAALKVFAINPECPLSHKDDMRLRLGFSGRRGERPVALTIADEAAVVTTS